jgi:uncharacterized membrane protein (DUF441 family)
MSKAELWMAIVAASTVLTFGVVCATRIQSKGTAKIEFGQVAWTFVGFVFAIAICIGFVTAFLYGYGDGDIF